MLSLQYALAANAGTPRVGRVFRFHRTARRIARTMEPAVAAAWMQALARFQSGISDTALRTALLSKDLAAAEAAIDASRFGQMMRDLEDPLKRLATATGTASAATLTAGGYTLGFNATHPNVILYARDQSATLVRRITETTREAIRTVIALGAQEGLTIETQARAIREVVGLPPSWAASPHHFEQELRAGDAAAATSRRLSAVDKQRIRSELAKGIPSDAFIQELRDRYTKSLINRRALNIARTETLAAANWGQQESWRQGAAGGHIPRGARRFWLATPSPSLCHHCAEIPGWNPRGVGIEEPFATPFGARMLPPAHPNCRCGIAIAMPVRGAAEVRREKARRALVKKRGGLGRVLGAPTRPVAVSPTLPLTENIPVPSFERSINGLEKKHIHLDRARMDRARAAWTDAEPGVRYQQTAALVNKAATEVTNAGFRVPELNLRLVPRGALPNGEIGWYEYAIPGGDALTFPVATFDEVRSGLSAVVRRQWFATRSIKGTVQHELGHALHSQFLKQALAGDSGAWMKTLGENWGKVARAISGADDIEMAAEMARIAREVSGYASISPSEFVAEMFTGMMQGEAYSTPAMQLYRDLYGPISKRWRRLFADTAGRKASAAERLLGRVRTGVKKAVEGAEPAISGVEEAMPKVWSMLTPAERELVKDVQVEFVKRGSLTSARGKASHGLWRPSERKIILETGGNWRTQAHELGHAIDTLAAGVSADADVVASIRAGLRADSYYTNLIRRAYTDEKQVREVVADMFVSMHKGQVRDLIGSKEMRARFSRAWEIMEKRLAALPPPPPPGGIVADLPLGGRLKASTRGMPSARAERATTTHKPATRAKQQLADRQQHILADALNGDVTKDNAPMDIVLTDNAGRTVGVEVKTFCDQVRGRVTMHPESMARKRTWARKNKGRMATMVVDARADFGFADLYSGTRYYVRKGIGGFNLDTMEGFDTLEDASDYIRAGFKRARPRVVGPRAYDVPTAPRAVLRGEEAVAHIDAAQAGRITDRASEAFRSYSRRYYEGINGGLRRGTRLMEYEQETIGHIDAAFAAVTPTENPMLVERGGLLRRADLKVGAEIIDPAFVSTSADGMYASRFFLEQLESGPKPPAGFEVIRARITVPRGTHVIHLDSTMSQYPKEMEILLQRGGRFRITSAEQHSLAKNRIATKRGIKTYTKVELEYIPPEPPRGPIARDLPGTGGGAAPRAVPPAKDAGPLTVEAFTKKAAEKVLASADDAAEELRALVPDADVRRVYLRSRKALEDESLAFFDPMRRSVHLGAEVTDQLEAFVAGARGTRAVNAVRTAVHEYIHSTSPLLRAIGAAPRTMKPGWAFIEEGLTEMKAQETALRFFGGHLPSGVDVARWGSYTDEVQAMRWLKGHFGQDLLDQLWALDTSEARQKLLNSKVREWLMQALPKRGMTVLEAQSIATDLGDDAWYILRVGDQANIEKLRSVTAVRDHFRINYGVKPPPLPQGKGRIIARDKPLRLEPLEKKAVRDYQSAGWNGIINGALRKGRASGILRVQGGLGTYDLGQAVQTLDAVLERAPRLKKTTILWRGLDGRKLKIRPGTVFTDKGYVSTSGKMQRAAEFMRDSRQPIMIRITAKKGQRGVWMKDAIGRTKEEEFLLPRGARFRVLKSRVMDHDTFGREVGRVGWSNGTGLYVTVLDVVALL